MLMLLRYDSDERPVAEAVEAKCESQVGNFEGTIFQQLCVSVLDGRDGPPYREKGIGHTLKNAADEWCRQAGAEYMRAYIGIGNTAMLRVCKLLGYEPWMVTWVRRFE